jgi:hypothetical protein
VRLSDSAKTVVNLYWSKAHTDTDTGPGGVPAPWREVSITCDVTVEGGEHHVLRVLSCLPFRAQSDGMRFGCAAVGPEELGSELVSIRLVCERVSECARGAEREARGERGGGRGSHTHTHTHTYTHTHTLSGKPMDIDILTGKH